MQNDSREVCEVENRIIMKTIWMCTKSVLAVVAGVVAMTLLAFVFEIPLRAGAVRFWGISKEALDVNIWWMLSQTLYTIPALVLGGYVAAALAPKNPIGHVVAMAVLQELLIVVLISNPPHPTPAWMWGLTLVVAPAAIITGGRLYEKRRPR